MAEGGDVSKIDCSICLTALTVPKLLPCFHTFCLQCLDEYVKRNRQDGKFECPLCRVCTVLPEGGVKSFQSDIYIQTGSLSEEGVVCDVCGDGHDATHYCMNCAENFCERCTTSHMKMKMSREHAVVLIYGSSNKSGKYTRKIQKKYKCDVCGDGHDANHYCMDCEENLCERCTTSHLKMKMSREHVHVQLKGLSCNSGKYTRKIQKKYYCSHPKGEEVNMVCKDCNVMLCVVCKLAEHNSHNTSSLSKEAQERRKALSTRIAEAKQELDVLDSRKCMTNNFASDIENNLKNSITALEARIKLMITNIKKGADTIKQELIKSNTEAKDYYEQKEKQMERKISEKQAVITHAQNVVKTADDIQVMNTELKSKLQAKFAVEECKIKHKDHLTLKVNHSKITADMIGKASELYYDIDVKVVGKLPSDFPGTTNANMLLLDADRLYAAFTDYDEFFYHDIKTSKSFFTRSLNTSCTCAGLAYIDKDVFFTRIYDKAIYKLTTENHKKTKFESFEQFPHGIASRPCRIHDKCKEKELLVCLLKSKKLSDLNASKGCVISICLRNKEQKIWRDKEMPGPACIATNEVGGTVCLGYPAANKVTLNTSKGIVLIEFSGEGCPGNSEVFCPVSVCFDRCGCIIVVDYRNGTVIRLDRLGNFIQCLVKKRFPLSVVCGEKNMLYVGFKDTLITRYQLVPKK